MKAIIKGLLYDTDTAVEIYRDRAKSRVYYMTANENFFVLYSTGEINPTSEENIKELLGVNDITTYIALFGEPKEA